MLVADIVPVLFEPFQLVGVQDNVGIPHIQGGKLYVEAVLFMR